MQTLTNRSRPGDCEEQAATCSGRSSVGASDTFAVGNGGQCEVDSATSLTCDPIPAVDSSQQPGTTPVIHVEPTKQIDGGLTPDPVAKMSMAAVTQLRHGLELWKTRAQGRTWCLRFGMLPGAWDAWSKMHVNPFAAMGFYFSSFVAFNVMNAYLVTAMPLNGSIHCYLLTGPLLLNLGLNCGLICAIWHYGPQVVHHKLYPLFLLVWMLCMLPLPYVCYIGPQSTVPWDNRLKAVAVGTLSMLFGHMAAAAGGVPGEQPPEPRTSIWKPLCHATLQTLRVMDSATDMSIAGEMIYERRDGCWMFGHPGRCDECTLLISAFCTLAAIDLLLALVRSVVGAEATSKSKRGFAALQCAPMACELGIVALTLVHLFSLKHPGNAARDDFDLAKTNSSIGRVFVSLITTLCTFTLTLVGVSNTLAAARKVLSRVSHAYKNLQTTDVQNTSPL